ncbi:MAG: hypothetical protein IJK47_06835 [Lachnospiraceae bacterium]|nr:hypothetical protein [Lachnospiraceae bacterium]
MLWPRRLFIINELLGNGYGGLGYLVCLAGFLFAVYLHRRDRKTFLWPVLPAVILYAACEVAEVNLWSSIKFGSSILPVYLILLLGYLLIGYIPGWLFMDLVCFLKDKKKKEKE